jgi:hypothetical protein
MLMFRFPLPRLAARAGRNRYTPRLCVLEDRILRSTCHVTRLADANAGTGLRGTLRYCINYANNNPGTDAIDFTVTGTIPLTGELPHLASDMSIIGPGTDLLAVDGQNHVGGCGIFYVEPGATVAISGLTITRGSGDGCPGGVTNDGTLVLKDSAVTNNYNFGSDSSGGGIWNDGKMTIWGTTVSGNFSYQAYSGGGGGIANDYDGVVQIISSTISGNYADYGGGGILNGGAALDIRFSTVTNNTVGLGDGSGLYTKTGNTTVYDTIIAGNHDAADVDGPYTGSANLIGGDPKLGPLQNNGGHTQTHALLPGSPAIDAGDNTGAPAYDQRGPGFPRIVNGTIDIGAFEVQNTAGPAGGRSILATAPRPAMATLGVPQPSPATPDNVRRPADRAPEPLPVATRQTAPLVVRVVPVSPAPGGDTADPLALDWR